MSKYVNVNVVVNSNVPELLDRGTFDRNSAAKMSWMSMAYPLKYQVISNFNH